METESYDEEQTRKMRKFFVIFMLALLVFIPLASIIVLLRTHDLASLWFLVSLAFPAYYLVAFVVPYYRRNRGNSNPT